MTEQTSQRAFFRGSSCATRRGCRHPTQPRRHGPGNNCDTTPKIETAPRKLNSPLPAPIPLLESMAAPRPRASLPVSRWFRAAPCTLVHPISVTLNFARTAPTPNKKLSRLGAIPALKFVLQPSKNKWAQCHPARRLREQSTGLPGSSDCDTCDLSGFLLPFWHGLCPLAMSPWP